MGKTSIEWTDKSWNPVTGCEKVSAGCANCYAEAFANRKMGPWTNRAFTDVRVHPERLNQPMGWKEPARIFVNSMSDLFHEAVPDAVLKHTLGTMTDCPQHIFQILTKRPKRMRDFYQRYDPMPNMWLGVSVENQKAADERIPILLQTPAAVRWLSVEPMLEKINLSHATPNVSDLDWVVCGGESGPNARMFNIGWARDLKVQCGKAGIPFFMKQLGAWPFEVIGNGQKLEMGYELKLKDRKGGDMAEWPRDLRVRRFPK